MRRIWFIINAALCLATTTLAIPPEQREINELYRRGLLGDKEAVESCIAKLEVVLRAQPKNELAVQHRNVGNALLTGGDATQALHHFREAVAIFERLMKEDPADARLRRSAAYGYRDLAEALATTGDADAAEQNFRTALASYEELAAADPRNAVLIAQQALTHLKLSRFFLANEQPARAVESARLAVRFAASSVSGNAQDVNALRTMAEAQAQLGDTFRKQAPASEASEGANREMCSAYEESQQRWDELKKRGAMTSADAAKAAVVARQLAQCRARSSEG